MNCLKDHKYQKLSHQTLINTQMRIKFTDDSGKVWHYSQINGPPLYTRDEANYLFKVYPELKNKRFYH